MARAKNSRLKFHIEFDFVVEISVEVQSFAALDRPSHLRLNTNHTNHLPEPVTNGCERKRMIGKNFNENMV